MPPSKFVSPRKNQWILLGLSCYAQGSNSKDTLSTVCSTVVSNWWSQGRFEVQMTVKLLSWIFMENLLLFGVGPFYPKML